MELRRGITTLLRSWLFTAALACGLAAYAATPLTTPDVWAWRAPSDAQISPDGSAVVFVLAWSDPQRDATYTNLWVAPADGTPARALTDGPYKDSSPRWSPDGTRVAYLTNRGGKRQLRVRAVAGGEVEVTHLEEAPQNLAWSPDGLWLAYTARVAAPPGWSVKMPEKPAGATWAPPAIVVTRLHWRDDAKGLVAPGFIHLFVVPAEGGAPRQISSGDFDHPGEPAWMPDGRTILISARRTPDAEYSLEGDDIYAFDVASGAVRQLTRRPGPDENPVPSPDGSRIAFVGNDYKQQSYFVRQLYVMNADGSRVRCLTGIHDRDVVKPQWSSDSRTVYLASDDRGGTALFAARMDGAVRRVTDAVERFGTYGSAPAFTLAVNGRVALVRYTPQGGPDVVTFAVDRPGERRRLTWFNDELLAGRTVAQVEEIKYSSFDDKQIQGWILKPPGFDASLKYPLLLDIHGGPHAMFGVEFSLQQQIFAARGFVVLYVNPRGSTGYGEEFGNVIHTRYPGDDYQDLMRGVDAVIARGYIDPARLAVTGGSGGGLLTAWIIGHTGRFAAAVSQYPVTNWITQVGTADSGYQHAAVWMKGMPWENPEQYTKHSPIFFAANFKTPTMVITGEADFRTPMAQSEELYFALKVRKVPAVLVRIPDEPHGIRGDHPSHTIAKIEHILGWVERYTAAK